MDLDMEGVWSLNKTTMPLRILALEVLLLLLIVPEYIEA